MHLILTHEQADFDAIAAMLAAHLLDEKSIPVLPHRMNRNVRAFLTLYGAELPFVEARDLAAEFAETVTLVDTQSLVTIKGITGRSRIHVVDHHQPRPDLPPDWTVSGDRTGACTTLLVEVLREHNGNLSLTEATLLLLGIYEDTGSLTYVSTTPRDVRAAAYLLEMGASLRIAGEYLNPPLSADQRQVYDRLIRSAQTHHIQGQNILIACAEAVELTEEISSVAHKLRDLLDPDALFLLIRTNDGVRMVARSTTDQVNVARIASHFGGGGHERAAAALIKEPLPFQVNDRNDLLQAACQELLRILPESVRPSITVGQIMSQKPQTLSPNTSVQAAAALMQRYGYEGYPVVQDGKVIGLLTRRDVDRAISHKLNLPVTSLMNAGEITVQPQDSISHLQRLMTSSGWGQIPVVDPQSGSLIGIVTRTDLLKTLSEGEERLPGRINLASRLDSTIPPARLALLKIVAEQARELHQAAYIVGGVVRDLLLDRPSLDFDVVVEGDAISLGRALTRRYGGRVVTHGRFGTAKWQIGEQRAALASNIATPAQLDPAELPESLDLISARTEFYEYPTALPTVERSSIKHDLHRRDFTINTMAIRLDGRHYGDLHDYWGGLNDLRQGLVRVLHSLSFVEDPTRMLRAVRFEQRFGFKIEARTLQLMDDARPMMRQVSGERLRHEMDLMLTEPKALEMLGRSAALELLTAIHPQLAWNPTIAARVERILTACPGSEWGLPAQWGHFPLQRALAYIAWFSWLPAEQAKTLSHLLRIPAGVQAAIHAARLLSAELPGLVNLPPSKVTHKLEQYPRVALFAVHELTSSDAERNLLQRFASEWSRVQPLTNGDDLRKMGLPPGPSYRLILDSLRQAWLDSEITSREEELMRLKELTRL